MAKFNPTPQQELALKAKGAVLVSAAAGSGKTAVLANRVFKRITDESAPIDITDMLIVTFTNAAAGEMRERIYTLLSEASLEQPDNKRLLEQKLSVDNASIFTIDRFCIDFLRENFVAAGVEPNFKILTGEQEEVLIDEAATAAYDLLAKEDFEAYAELLVSMNSETVDKDAKKAVTEIYKHICSLPMPDRWLDGVCRMYDCEAAGFDFWLEYVCKDITAMTKHYLYALNRVLLLIEQNDVVYANYYPITVALIDLLGALFDCGEKKDYDGLHTVLKYYSLPEIGRASKNSDAYIKDRAKAVVDEVRDEVKKYKDIFAFDKNETVLDIKTAGKQVKTLVRLVKLFRERFDKIKQDKGYMTFSDVELKTLQVLCEDIDGQLAIRPEAKELTTRYKEVMVDEYQDTNDLQNAIFNALSNDGQNMFLVGDVKQSIYRFRHANPLNFIKMRDEFPDFDDVTYPSKIILSGNFRSRPAICDFANYVFDALMTRQSSQIDYLPGDWLDPIATGLADNADCGAEVHLIDNGTFEDESAHIASYIKDCVEQKMQVSDGKGGLRDVKYSDFLILLRSYKSNSVTVVSALRARNIPVLAELKTDYYSRTEIMIIMSLLQAIDNPLKDIPLLSALMSPVFGFDADEIAQIRIGKREESIYSSLLEAAKHSSKCARFLDMMAKYRSWAATLPSDRLITKIYDDTGLLAIARAMDDGASRKANLLLLTEFAATYEQNGYKGLTSFLRYVERVANSNSDITGGTAVDTEDAVRVMTVHKSKGLQAPVCIVAALESKFNLRDASAGLVMHEQGGIGMRVCDSEKAIRYDTFARKIIANMEIKASVAEEMRLLYVAMTRAQEKLVVMSAEKNLAKKLQSVLPDVVEDDDGAKVAPYSVQNMRSLSEWLYVALLMHPDGAPMREYAQVDVPLRNTDGKGTVAVKIINSDSISCSDYESYKAEPIEIDLSDKLDYCYPYESLLKIESKYSVSALAKDVNSDEFVCTARPAFLNRDGMTPAERGTATHRFMCYADYERAMQSITKETELLVEQGKLTSRQADGVDESAVAAFFKSDLCAEILKAKRVIREGKFIYELPVSEIDSECNGDETVILQGVADCVLFDDAGITVVDFKTDRNIDEKELIDRYTKQLQLYARAFSANYSMPIKRCLIYSFWLNKTVEVVI